MSARFFPVDWKIERAMWALSHRPGRAIDIAYYAEVFEIDADATLDLFVTAARTLGIDTLELDPMKDGRH